MNEGRDLAKHLGCRFMETSAKQPINVDESFFDIVREIRKYNKEQKDVRPGGPRGTGPSEGNIEREEHSGGCCSGCVVL